MTFLPRNTQMTRTCGVWSRDPVQTCGLLQCEGDWDAASLPGQVGLHTVHHLGGPAVTLRVQQYYVVKEGGLNLYTRNGHKTGLNKPDPSLEIVIIGVSNPAPVTIAPHLQLVGRLSLAPLVRKVI